MLEGEKVAKRFGGVVAVNNADFFVNEGEIVGLIGPNGAGKTTLFNLVTGSLVPTSGSIRFEGQDITGWKPHRICKKGIARTFQLVKLFGNMTVLENILFGSLFGSSIGIGAAASERQCLEIIKFVGLSNMGHLLAKELPLASQKRLEIARSLATGPKLLLLDEFMAGLNPAEVSEAIDLIRKIRDRGITIFMIEHVMKAIMDISDRVMVLHFGTKIAEGKPEEIARDRRVIEVYLGTQDHAQS